MIVYRISKLNFANDLTGIGASLYGGRWNPKGVPMVYTASSIALASLEYLVHNLHIIQSADLCLSKIHIAQSKSIASKQITNLPSDWNENTYLPLSTQEIGAAFFNKGNKYLLKVPSAVVPGEYNYLLNPMRSEHLQTTIKEQIFPFSLDSRLFKFIKSNP